MAIKTLKETIETMPEWARLAIKPKEARAFNRVIRKNKPKSALEIGVASGCSSAVLYSLLAQNTDAPQIYSFDLAEDCYFDNTKKTGQAFAEVHGSTNGFNLTTGVTAADIKFDKMAEFCFVDANHDTPWAAFDVLSLCRYLKPKSIIALHDVAMIFRERVRDKKNGSRDIMRAWQGDKFRYAFAPNLGFMRYESPRAALDSVTHSIALDWDTKITEEQAEKFKAIGRELSREGSDDLARVIDTKMSSPLQWRMLQRKKRGSKILSEDEPEEED